MATPRQLLAGLAVIGSVLIPDVALSAAFSVDPASAHDPAALFLRATVLDSGATSLGLQAGDDLTAISTGIVGNVATYFSVDRSSTGVAGSAVRAMSVLGGQGASVFLAGGAGCIPNCLIAPHTQLGLTSGDNIDALMGFGTGFSSVNFFFTLGRGSPTLAALGASSADILLHRAGGSLSIALTAAALGLTQLPHFDPKYITISDR